MKNTTEKSAMENPPDQSSDHPDHTFAIFLKYTENLLSELKFHTQGRYRYTEFCIGDQFFRGNSPYFIGIFLKLHQKPFCKVKGQIW